MRKVLPLLTALLTLALVRGSAQVSFTGEYTQNFNTYAGTIASLPAGWTFAGTPLTEKGIGNGSSNAGGLYAFGTGGEYALGYLHSGSASPVGSYSGTFTNSTGATITSLSIAYDFEQWRGGGSNTTGFPTVTVNGVAVAALGATGTASIGTTPTVTHKSAVVAVSVAAGATITIKWQADDQSGSENGIGVDNFVMCVPGKAFAVTAGSNTPVTAPSPLNLTSSPTGGTAAYTYSWSGPLSYANATQNPVITPSDPTNSGTYSVTVTDALGCTSSANTAVVVNPGAGGCTGTPDAGTASVATSSFCNSGSTTLTLTGGTTTAGVTYQWASSATSGGSYTDISGATSIIYNTPVLTATTYYVCKSTCTTTSSTSTSSEGTVTIHSLPTITATPEGGSICSGGSGLSMTASGGSTYVWSPSTGLSSTVGATINANPVGSTIYTITGTDAFTCVNTHTVAVTYNLTPNPISITPSSLNMCLGSAPQLLTATGGGVGPSTVSSGSISVDASGAHVPATSSVTMGGVPAGAVITGASITMNFASNFLNDYVFNLMAPNGSVLNLVNMEGPHGAGSYSATTISSAGVTPLVSGGSPFTGVFAADLVPGAGPAGFVSGTSTWSDLYTIPNGAWTLLAYNNSTFTNTPTALTSWSVTLTYSYPLDITWSPATNLSTDAGGSTAYTGTPATTVYAGPGSTPATIAYVATSTNAGCPQTSTVNVTVNPLPSDISGPSAVCVGQTITLTDAGSGTWSAVNANATIDATTGIVTGVTAGVDTITYTLPTGCTTTVTVNVNALPDAITGIATVCEGLTTTLTDGGGGTWSASNANATIDATTGIVTGVTAGNDDITYTLPTGCTTIATVTVNATPAAITGTTAVCVGLTTTLATTTTDGTWSAGNTNATIDPATGIATGVTAGNDDITYTLSTGCYATTVLTVNALPAAISGTGTVCAGLTTTLTDAGGGAWSASNANATIDATTGIATGVTAGNDDITYTLSTGCITISTITVNPLPAAITGTATVCAGLTTTLADATIDGAWSASNANATVDAATGVVTGVTAGNDDITYTLPTGCITATTVTVNALPAAISGTASVCIGLTTTLTDAGSGTWSASNANATIDATTGIATGVTAGTDVVTYTLPTGCITTTVLSVNALPAAISGTGTVCAGLTTTLTDAGGGTWSASNANATVDATTGVVTGVTAGNDVITYTLSTSCITTTIVTVNALPSAISGTAEVCVGLTTTLTNTGGGTWSASNANATIDVTTGIATGITAGTDVVTYTLSTGCITTTVLTIDPLPAAIGGTAQVCIGLTTTLTDAGGGTWSAANANATIDAATGVVTGVTAGNDVVTYTLSTGCITTAIVTVNPLPAAISGTAEVCVGLTTAFSDAGGGAWSVSNANATIDVATGVATGVTAGNDVVTYTLPTGCIATTILTIDPLPVAITGTAEVCAGLTTTLSAAGGGTWNAANANATVGATTGIVTGVTAGTDVVTYTLPTGCITTTVVTIDALPAAITGTGTVCVGNTTALTDAGGGTWSASNANATVDAATGVVTGAATGNDVITYTLSTGCITTTIVTVHALPAAITGIAEVCVGSTTTLADGGGGTWSAGNVNATVGSTTGVVTGVTAGNDDITYTLPTGCIATVVATIDPLPAAIGGPSAVCIGSSITLTDAGSGTWSASNARASIDATSGVVTGVTNGTDVITYTLPTGCKITKTISVNPLPSAISGATEVCVGSMITLTDAGGGTWSKSNANVNIGATSGIVTGVTAGTDIITYTLSTGCTATKIITINALPAAIAGASQVCVGSTTTLTDGGGGTWSRSNTNATVGASSGIVAGITAGNDTITYTLSTGCFVRKTITVNPLPAAITGADELCAASEITLSDAGGGTWSAANANASIDATTGIVTGVTGGTDIITYTLSTGCNTTKTITVDAAPAAHSVTGGGHYCADGSGLSVGLLGSETGIDYQLYNGAATVGSVAHGTGADIDFGLQTAAGTYTVAALNTTTTCTAAMPGSAVIVIDPIVVPSVTVTTATGDTVCGGSAVTFTATPAFGGTAPVYEWKINGTVIAGSTDNTYSYTPTDNDTVRVLLTSNYHCAVPDTAFVQDTITVLPMVMPSVTITVSPGNPVCADTAITFTAHPVNGGDTTFIRWTENHINVATGPTYTYVPANGDAVYCMIGSSARCRLADSVFSDTTTMIVEPHAPTPVVTIVAVPGTTIAAGQSDTLIAMATGASAYTYQWYNGSTIITGATDSAYISSSFANNDSVTCVVTSQPCGASVPSSLHILVDNTGVATTGVMDNVSVSPNPNKGTFVIKGYAGATGANVVTLEMTDLLGQVVYRKNIAAQNGNINETVTMDNNLSDGIYLLNLRSGSEHKVFRILLGK